MKDSDAHAKGEALRRADADAVARKSRQLILVDPAAHRIGYFDRVDHGVVSDDSRRGVERKSALSVRARQVALAVRSFLIRAEDFLVAVRARAEAKISFILRCYARD